jgi:peptidyl-prolyl cis-trans isomerase B (cyclophilin B)
MYQPPPGTNLLAIASLPMSLVFPPVGVGLAHMARNEIRRSGEGGLGLTTAALVLGYGVSGLWVVFWLAIGLSVAAESV